MTDLREQVFQALFGLLAEASWNIGTDDAPAVKQFVTKTRRIVLFDQVPTAQQPWVGQAEHGETFAQKTNLPYKRTWDASWMVYHQAGSDPKAVPTITNNLIISALERVIAPKPTDPGFLDERNTLQGLVYHCFISGAVFKDPGDIDNQALIVVPIKLLVP